MTPVLKKYLLVSCCILLAFTTNTVKAATTVNVTGINAPGTGTGQNGITTGTLSYGQNNIVLYGFSITGGTASPAVTGFQLSSTQPYGNYFSNLRLVKSTTNNYSTGTLSPVSATLAASGTTLTVTNFGQTIPANNTYYYFLVADFTINGTNNITFQVNNFSNLTPNTYSLTTTTIAGNNFTIPPPTITATGNNVVGSPPTVPTGNGISATTLAFGQTGVVFFGFSLTDSNAPTTVTAINLFANNPVAAWCTNFKIYSSPTTVFDITTATQITTATITTTASNTKFAITNLSQTFALGQTLNYFIVADFTQVGANIALPNTTQFGSSNIQITSSVSNTTTVNSAITGQTFNLSSPILTISNYNTGVYTGTAIAAGGTYNLLGFNLSYSGPINMHQLVIDMNFATGGNFNSGYISSVNLIDASTGLTAAHLNASGVQNQGTKITVNFDGTAFSTSTNYYIQVTFASSFSVHQPGTFTMCLNAASNPTSVDCQNNSGCIVNDTYLNSNGTACSNPFVGQSIIDWIGTTLTNGDDWNVATNWSPNKVPGPYDIAREGVLYGFNKLPVVYTTQSGSTTINVGSILFGSTTSGAFTTLGVSVSNGYTLNVNGDITMQSDAQSYRNYPVNLAGNGTIRAANLNILTSNTANTHAISAGVNSSVNSLILSGNIKLTSDYTAAYSMAYNSTFNLTGGTANITGVLQSINTANSLSTFAVIPPTGSTAVLQLENATALSGLSTTPSSNTLSFNNAGAKVVYSGAAQTVYTDTFITGLTGTTGPIYYSFGISGSGTKTPNGGSLQIYGDFTNNRGTGLTLTTTPVLFEGTAPQSLKDNSSNNTLFSTVSFSGPSTKTISAGNFAVASTGTLNITGTSTTILNAGTNQLTLNSDANGSATVSKINGPSITGAVNVQRFVTGGSSSSRGYHIITSPVNISSSTSGTGFIDLSYLNTGTNAILTAGLNGTANGFSVANANPLIYLYDETRTSSASTFVAGKNVGIAAISGATAIPALSLPAYSVIPVSTTGASMAAVQVPVGNSFLLYFVGSNSSSNITSTLRPIPDNATATAVGYLNQGTIPVKLWKTPASTALPYDVNGSAVAGISQVGNPYPSTISLDQLYIDNYSSSNAISSFFYELIPGGGYVYYNASGTHNVSDLRASKYIVSGQGFLVRTTIANQTLTFYEGEKVPYPTSFYNSNSSTPALLMSIPSTPSVTNTDMVASAALPAQTTGTTSAALHVQITKDSVTYSQTGVYFNSTTSDKFNGAEDAADIGPGTAAVYLSSYSSDGTRLGVNQLGSYTPGKRIKLYAGATTTGEYTMSLADLVNVDTSLFNVYLVDNKMNDSLDMVHYKSYAFNINTADTTTYGANRFVLAIEHKYLPQYMLISFSGKKVNNGIQLYWQTLNAGNNTGFILQKLNTGNTYDPLYRIQSNSSPFYVYTDEHPTTGNNTYRLQQTDVNGTVTYSAPVTIYYNALIANGSLTVYPNPSKSIINISLNTNNSDPAGYIADIYDLSGNVVAHKNVNSNHFTQDISSYKLGIYIIELKTNGGNLLGKAKFVKTN